MDRAFDPARSFRIEPFPGKRSNKRSLDLCLLRMELVEDSFVLGSVTTVDIQLSDAVFLYNGKVEV